MNALKKNSRSLAPAFIGFLQQSEIKMRKIICLYLIATSLTFAANQTDLQKLIELQKTQTTSRLDLSNADLRDYPFLPGKIDLQQANLSHSNLANVNLSKMNLGGSNLSYADLSHANLSQTNLAGANLDHANLAGAQLQQSDLSGANLNYAVLSQANLTSAILAKTNLMCANLNQADLNKATLTGANIAGASFVNTATADIVDYNTVVDQQVSCE
jgi:uncharacterized protein YjbI with pentapeptide repeats